MNSAEKSKNDLYNMYFDVFEGKGTRYYNSHYSYIKKIKTNPLNEEKGISPPTGLTDTVLNSLLKKQLSNYNEKEKKKEDFPKRKRKRIDDILIKYLQK